MSGKDRVPGSDGRPGEHGKIGQAAARITDAQQRAQDRSAGQPPGPQPDQPQRTENPGWAIISYLIAGMLFYGGIGWLIGRWTGYSAVFLPAGLLIGLGLALALVIFRYGRS
jgi:ATP synthase protein I